MGNKPRFRSSSLRWLTALWEHIEQRDSWRQEEFLRQAPADLFDGWCTPSDLADLVRRRILQVIPVRKEDQTSVSPVTWLFTDRGMAIMRAWKAASPAEFPDVVPEGCCPNCGAPL